MFVGQYEIPVRSMIVWIICIAMSVCGVLGFVEAWHAWPDGQVVLHGRGGSRSSVPAWVGFAYYIVFAIAPICILVWSIRRRMRGEPDGSEPRRREPPR